MPELQYTKAAPERKPGQEGRGAHPVGAPCLGGVHLVKDAFLRKRLSRFCHHTFSEGNQA